MEKTEIFNYYKLFEIKLKNNIKIKGILKKIDRFYNLEIKFKNHLFPKKKTFKKLFFSKSFSIILRF
ncbi:hypothetical protein HAN_2g336 (nucleomorph) [Hemiselmis andersenii]|uniref:LSM domain-containing protein n=1 Tax=Hemiselmis andersenii TaxID=464988 RepID=A9BKI3_HEMAN|nr:hypothetical protein HAN_2g336 [Hemiselmis andersenii]ABW98154.1 hypothetical protein HAN_2g336 [Hemiselmis andersenii]